MAWRPRRHSSQAHDMLGRSVLPGELPLEGLSELFKDELFRKELVVKDFYKDFYGSPRLFGHSGLFKFSGSGCFLFFGLFVLSLFAGALGGISQSLGYMSLSRFLLGLAVPSILMCLFGGVICGIVLLIIKIVVMFRLRVRGVQVTGVALDTLSVKSTDTDSHGRSSTSTSYYTKVGFVVGGDRADRHVVTISGKYAVGRGVPMVHDPDNPEMAYSESNIRWWVRCVILVVIGLVIFALINFR